MAEPQRPRSGTLTVAKICDTTFTIEYVRRAICDSEGAESRLIDWKAEDLTGKGFCSYIIHLHLEWAVKDLGLPTTVILKIPQMNTLAAYCDDEAFKWFAEWLPLAHYVESQTYELLAHGQRQRFAIPHCYKTRDVVIAQTGPYDFQIQEEGILIIQDFTSVSTHQSLIEGHTLGQVLSIAKELAHIHAFCIKNQGEWEARLRNQTKLEFAGWVKFLGTQRPVLKEAYPELYAEIVDKCDWCFEGDLSWKLAHESHEWLSLPGVLCHGDLWCNQILFAKDDDGSANDNLVAIIDWQCAHVGNVMEDFCRLLLITVTPELRRSEQRNVIAFYHEQLTGQLGDRPVPFSLEQAHRAFDVFLPYGLVFCLGSIGVLINSPHVDGDDREANKQRLNARMVAVLEDTLAVYPNGYVYPHLN